jgi:hypothetical protein
MEKMEPHMISHVSSCADNILVKEAYIGGLRDGKGREEREVVYA